MNDKYVDLKMNGRLFPSWILLNFKDYKLPPTLRVTDDDPCKRKTKLELRKYQKFISSFLDYRSPYKDILLYHGLGSGKTATTINLMNILYNYTPTWNVFILIKASLKSDWMDEINKWLSTDEFKNRMSNIKFINYDSPFADKNFLDNIKNSDSSKKSLYIFDEVHNFINNVYNNITSKQGKRAWTIYDYIQQEKRDNDETRIVLITGTPAINNPYEIALIFNLLRPGIFPESEMRFNEIYVKSNKLDNTKKNMFQRRIMGLVSYYSAQDRQLFADKNFKIVELDMEPIHQEVYEYYESIEAKLEKRKKSSSSKISSTYKSYTRQSSNFIFPSISRKINGEARPRPSSFKMDEAQIQKILEGNDEDLDLKDKSFVEYLEVLNLFLKELKKYFDKFSFKDIKEKYSLKDDLEIFKKKYNSDFSKFLKEQKKKSSLFVELYQCSCKMTAMIFNSFSSKGPLVMYSNYVRMEGLEILKLYLSFFGFSSYKGSSGKDFFRYTEFHGSISMEERTKNKKAFNDRSNVNGKLIKIILISPAGSEGINLLNVRQVHVLEPYWNEVKINQLIGRAIRQCSHADLPMNERYVDIFRYIAKRSNNKETTDQNIQSLANKKYELINSFLVSMKEVAIDCELFKNQNIKDDEYRCFRFNQDSLFEKNIGPAYKIHDEIDQNLDDGSNSINSDFMSVDVINVKAVKKLDDGKYSGEIEYYMDEDTGILYDIDLEFPIGKVYFDEDGVPEMLKKGVYIISEIIPIPLIKK